MQPEQHTQVAEMVREHRQQLAELARELANRGEPLTALEARLVVDAAEARLKAVEDVLRAHGEVPVAAQAPRRSLRDRARFVRERVRSWLKPRIGRLRHYEPKPLRVPARYFAVRPPDPAPAISIVTPSFQQGKFLERTLYSVISQKYPSLEYAVQDGGSSDVTLEVLARFEPWLTRWVSEPDSGQADAINRAFEYTSGEIMAWLNSDDLLLPGSLAYVARYFSKHPEVDVVYGNRIMIDDGDGQVGAWILPRHNDLALTLADYIPQETLFWRRWIWDAAGACVDPSFVYALDWDLLLRFRDAGAKIVHLPRFLAAFRVHDEQKTTANEEIGFEECSRLRERVHGRHVRIDEVLERLRPYLVRHIVVHTWHRAVDRLPLPRRRVTTIPLEPWLRAPEAAGVTAVGSGVPAGLSLGAVWDAGNGSSPSASSEAAEGSDAPAGVARTET